VCSCKNRAAKRTRQSNLSENILRPLRKQLAEVEGDVKIRKRLEHWNANFWREIKNSGDLDRLPRRVRNAVLPLFENLFPKLDMSVIKANEAITGLGNRWDAQYGQTNKSSSIKSCGISWWIFLTDESFRPV
jgi:hypothetical protein